MQTIEAELAESVERARQHCEDVLETLRLLERVETFSEPAKFRLVDTVNRCADAIHGNSMEMFASFIDICNADGIHKPGVNDE